MVMVVSFQRKMPAPFFQTVAVDSVNACEDHAMPAFPDNIAKHPLQSEAIGQP